jgi:hypothetical protein
MDPSTILFLDTEFTALRQDAELVSLALVAEAGESFYAEIAGLDTADCDPWVREHVLSHCQWLGHEGTSAPVWTTEEGLTSGFAAPDQVAEQLRGWLARWPQVEIWTDGGAWDWVLFCGLLGGALALPENIFYLPLDLVTLLKLRGVDPDVDRLAFAAQTSPAKQPLRRHHALDDALVLMACYRRLMKNAPEPMHGG